MGIKKDVINEKRYPKLNGRGFELKIFIFIFRLKSDDQIDLIQKEKKYQTKSFKEKKYQMLQKYIALID